MHIKLIGCAAALIAAVTSGCMSVSSTHVWVTDSDYYWKLSGFSVQAPSGPNWFRTAKNEDFPNSILFMKVEQTPIRNNAYHPDFTVTSAFAYGASISKRVPRESDNKSVKEVLRQSLMQYQKKAGLVVEKSYFDSSLGAECLTYQGKPTNPDVSTDYGVVRYDGVTGYLCLHPNYDDFFVVMESRNGASVEIMPANRRDQTDHFFKSIRFTPRDIPSLPAGPLPKEEGKRITG